MRESKNLSLYLANQLPTLLIAHPTFKFIGLRLAKTEEKLALHSIYIEKENVSEELPFRALVTVIDWDGKAEEEEFFLEALSADRLIEKLQSFDDISAFVFFKIPKSITMDTVNMYPLPMFCKLFPELGEFNRYGSPAELSALKEAAITVYEKLDARLKEEVLR